jgi:Holliday junction resolvasome RuvABC DNA-binding subunit
MISKINGTIKEKKTSHSASLDTNVASYKWKHDTKHNALVQTLFNFLLLLTRPSIKQVLAELF